MTATFDTTRLLAFIVEREAIRIRKERGDPDPLTDDPILREWSFCNIHREHDRVTRWLAENWRAPNADNPDLWFAMVVARFVNWPDTLTELGFPVPWDPERFLAVMVGRKARGEQQYGPGYMIRAGNKPGQEDKPAYQAKFVFDPLWRARERVRPKPGDRLAVWFGQLEPFHGMGGFMAAQVVADMKYVAPLNDADDWRTWAASGPGSRRGMCRVLGRPLPTDRQNAPWRAGEPDWLTTLRDLQAQITPNLERAGIGRLCAQDLQNCLCEYDKFERTRLGEGTPKRRYRSAGASKSRSATRPVVVTIEPAPIAIPALMPDIAVVTQQADDREARGDSFPVTFFMDTAAQTLEARELTLRELAELIGNTRGPCKDSLPLLKLATFGSKRSDKNCLRHDKNVETVYGVECDYDDEEMSFDEAVQRARSARVSGIIYTSPSHQPTEPRWRAIFPFAGAMFAADGKSQGRNNMADRANAIFGGVLSSETWALSQPYYYGRVNDDFRIEVIDGDPIDTRHGLGATGNAINGHAPSAIGGLPKKWQDVIRTGDASDWGGKRWRAVCAVARLLVDRDWSDIDITALLLNRDYGISTHAYDKGNPERTVSRALALARQVPPEIEEINTQHAVILVGDKVAVLREAISTEGQPEIRLLGVDAFRTWLAPRRIAVSRKKKGEIVEEQVPLANVWLTHRQRREYQGLVFAPGAQMPGYYNLWRGFAVEPRAGDCSLFLAHLRQNVCRGDDALYRWVVAWFAAIFQRPGEKVGTSLVLRGKMGTGKTKVGEVVGSVLGNHYAPVSDPRYITGRFNSHLVSCLLLHADEGFWAGDRAAEGRLKDLVTGDSQFIEFKGKEPVRVRNHVRLLVSGNPDWLVPAGMEERRFAVLEMGENHTQDHAYFAAIDAEMEKGGREALLDHLLRFDLSGINLRAIPKTEPLLDQKLESLGAIERWWLTTLREGRLPGGCAAPNTCPVKALYQRYLDHSSMIHHRTPRAIETQFGMTLRRLMPLSKAGKPDLRRFRDGYYTHNDGSLQTGYVYALAPLTKCRQEFERLIGQKVGWESDPIEVDAPQLDIEPRSGEEVGADWETDSLPTLLASPT